LFDGIGFLGGRVAINCKTLQKIAKGCKTYTKCCQTFEKVAQKDTHKSEVGRGKLKIKNQRAKLQSKT